MPPPVEVDACAVTILQKVNKNLPQEVDKNYRLHGYQLECFFLYWADKYYVRNDACAMREDADSVVHTESLICDSYIFCYCFSLIILICDIYNVLYV